MELFWSKKLEVNPKTSDPLGFNIRMKAKMFNILFRGLTNPVSRAKYYSLFPMFLSFLESKNQLNYNSLLKLERTFLLANYKNRQEGNTEEYNGLLGINAITSLSDEAIESMEFEIFGGNDSGFNRLKGNLRNIGLIKGSLNNDLKFITTQLGSEFLEFSKLKSAPLEDSKLIDIFKKEDICNINVSENELLRNIFLGNYDVTKKKDDYIVLKSKPFGLLYNITPNHILNDKTLVEQMNRQAKIRHDSIIYLLHIFKNNLGSLLDPLIKDCIQIKNDKFEDIRSFWRCYFITCAVHEICDLTMYYFYELLRKNWNNVPNTDSVLKWSDIENKLNLIKEEKESSDISENIYFLNNNYKDTEKLPNKIKHFYGLIVNEIKTKLSNDFIKLMSSLTPTNKNIKEFLEFYEKNKDLPVGTFFLMFFKEYCLQRQKEITYTRSYMTSENVLISDTETEIYSNFYSSEEEFDPRSILAQTKITLNIPQIFSDLQLTQGKKLTEFSEKILKEVLK